MADETPQTQFKLRLPALLKERLEIAAAENARSITAEIVQRLEDSFPSVEATLMHNRKLELHSIVAEIARATARLEYFRSRAIAAEGERDAATAAQIIALENELAKFHTLEAEAKNAIAVLETRLKSKHPQPL